MPTEVNWAWPARGKSVNYISSEVKVAQSCLTLCDPVDYTVHGILQARIVEWVAFPFSRDLPNAGILQADCRQIFFYQLSHKGSPKRYLLAAYDLEPSLPHSAFYSQPCRVTLVSSLPFIYRT